MRKKVPDPFSPSVNVENVDLKKLEGMDPQELLAFAFGTFGDRAAIGTSLQKSGVVLIDMASRLGRAFRVFFIDTLVNPPQTYELLDQVESRYGISVERFQPRPEDIESLYQTVGQHAHFFARSQCCHVRKVVPLWKAQDKMDVWIAGLRAEQSEHRRDREAKASIVLAHDRRPLLKLNPLFDWTDEQIEAYIRDCDVPTNKLYDYVSQYGERYFIIGCEPCHIPVREDLGRRAGKFPWEQGKKECGLHGKGGGI